MASAMLATMDRLPKLSDSDSDPESDVDMDTEENVDNNNVERKVEESNNENGESKQRPAAEPEPKMEESPGEIDIVIHNVMSCFDVKCQLNLKYIGRNGINVEHKVGMNTLTMRFRKPRCTAMISATGKVTMVGSTSEEMAKIGARRCARIIQKLQSPKVKFADYKVVNVLGTCVFPFAIRLESLYDAHRNICEYEPLLHPSLTLKIPEFKATIQVAYIGKLSILAPSVSDVESAVIKAYELLVQFKKVRSAGEIIKLQKAAMRKKGRPKGKGGMKKKSGLDEYEEFDLFIDNGEEEEKDSDDDDEMEGDTGKSATTTSCDDEDASDSNEGDDDNNGKGITQVQKKLITKRTVNQKRKRKMRKTKPRKKSGSGTGTSTDTGSETETDADDDSDYMPEPKRKKAREERSVSSLVAPPKSQYSLRRSNRSRGVVN